MGCRYVLLLWIVAATMRDSSAAARPQIRFRGLPANQKVVIDFKSTGCYHRLQCKLEYSRLPSPAIRVEEVVYPDSGGVPSAVDHTTDRGLVALHQADVRRLDNLLRFYRTRRKGRCTTLNDVTFSLRQGDRVLTTETFQDSSCYADDILDADPADLKILGIKDPPVLSLFRVIATADARPKKVALSKPIPLLPPGMGDDTTAGSEANCHRRAMRIPGYRTAGAAWTITEACYGDVFQRERESGLELTLWLKSRRRRLIDSVNWENPVANGREEATWYEMAAAIRRLEVKARSFRWLRQWKAAEADRSIEAFVVGAHIDAIADADVRRIWRSAGLAGQPELEVSLERDRQSSCFVCFSSHEGKALILDPAPAKPAHRVHWLDTISGPVVVDRLGNWRVVNNEKADGAGGIVPQAAARPTA